MRKWIGLFTLVFLALLALDAYPGLRGGAGWRWPYATPDSWTPVLVLAALIAVYITGALLLRRINWPVWIKLGWSILGGFVIALGVVGVRGDAGFLLFTRTVSPVQTGAVTLAVREMAADSAGVQATLERWPDVMRESLESNLIHFTTSPPGQPLIHHAAAQLLDVLPREWSMALRPYQCSTLEVARYTHGEMLSAGLGMLMPLWAALAVIPVYAAGGMIFTPIPNPLSPKSGEGALRSVINNRDRKNRISPTGNPTSASGDVARRPYENDISLVLAQWWPLIPTVLLFAPTWNTVYPFLCVTAFALLLAGMRRASGVGFALYSLGGGVVMSLTTFLNFAVLPVLLLFGLFTLGYWFTFARERGLMWPVIVGLWFGLGLVSLWIPFWLVTGYTPLDILQVTFDLHKDLVIREYLPWLILHPYDMLLFIGWPVTGLFLWGVWRSLRGGGTVSEYGAAPVLALAMCVTLLLVNISGVAQGENGRILSFYAPFVLLAGGVVIFRRSDPIVEQPLDPTPALPVDGEGANARQAAPPLLAGEAGRGSKDHIMGDAARRPYTLNAYTWDIPLLITQGLTVLVMAAVLPVVPLDLNPQPQAPRQDIPTLDGVDSLPVGATFYSEDHAGTFTLDSQRFVADLAAQVITLELTWEGGAQVERPYLFEIVAQAENPTDGVIVAEPFRWYAQNGNYLPTCWRPGDIVRDVVLIPLPAVSEPVIWDLTLQAVDARTGDVMRVESIVADSAESALLGPVRYP